MIDLINDQITHRTIILINSRYIIVERDKCDIDIERLRNGNFSCS